MNKQVLTLGLLWLGACGGVPCDVGWRASEGNVDLQVAPHPERIVWMAVQALSEELALPDLQEQFINPFSYGLHVRSAKPRDWTHGRGIVGATLTDGSIEVLCGDECHLLESSLAHELIHLYTLTVLHVRDPQHQIAGLWGDGDSVEGRVEHRLISCIQD